MFIGKVGASHLAEVTYFDCPSIITLCATDIEKWISNHYVKVVNSAIKQTNLKKVRKLVEKFYHDKEFYNQYKEACNNYKGTDGAYKLADYIWEMLVNNSENKNNQEKKTIT